MRIEKQYIAKEMEERYRGSTLLVVAAYHGLNANDMTKLRARVAEQQGVLNVVKNRIAQRVVGAAGAEEFKQLLKGPNAIAATRGDAVALAKAMTQFAKENNALVIRGGLLDLSRYLTAEEIAGLAALPPREVLLARLLGGLQGPARNLACVFSTMIGNLVRVLEQVGKKKPAGGAKAEAAAEPGGAAAGGPSGAAPEVAGAEGKAAGERAAGSGADAAPEATT